MKSSVGGTFRNCQTITHMLRCCHTVSADQLGDSHDPMSGASMSGASIHGRDLLEMKICHEGEAEGHTA